MQYEFANCLLDTDRHEVRRDGVVVEVEPQVFDLLHLLVRRAGEMVSKDTLGAEIWGGRIVSDSAISARIAAVRKAVGDDGKAQAIIRTVARRGVQFVADVKHTAPAAPATELCERPPVRFTTAPDGARIAWSEIGSGPPLIQMAHFPSNMEAEPREVLNWKTTSAIARHRRVIRFDYRGSGLSERQFTDPMTACWSSDILAVADAAGLDRFAVWGQSSGAFYAVHLASDYPDRVSHLIVQGGYVDGRDARRDATVPSNDDLILRMQEQGWAEPQSPYVSGYIGLYFPDAPKSFLVEATAAVQEAADRVSVVTYRNHSNAYSVADRLAGVKAPTLVVHSRHDWVHPLSEARKMAAGIADAELAVFDSPNHYILPHEACWQAHVDAILGFLAKD